MEVDDVWDDTELIKMYDESLQEISKNETSAKITSRKFKGEDGKMYTWKVGGKCMAPYEENGEVTDYPATIDTIGGADNLEVGVTFIYYGGQAVVQMKDLWLNEEAIADAVKAENDLQKTKKTSTVNSVAHSNSKSTSSAPNTSMPFPSFAPPVPPNIIAMAPVNQKEAMNSMLMSWYMSGYHTGYYQALADQKNVQN
ncbi:Tudor domain-containing protein [Caenorhabditis elegans]|nr:Tudor domain-containing protein [Caenorhabditis elegans]CAB02838.1 Tudor domain-containing protein [Caenorhabditis elegans]CAB41945.1 SMN protein [Caenorhabditis elegans]|eukprot:NP_492525.2 SMN (human Survival Motor Neuron gene) homolog [Caenorhabditis elegans]